jgi:UDP-3-O-acyl-N-acetylglucosamine deacetylase
VGDLFLAGYRIVGHYHGVKAGHAMNNKILHVLFANPDAYEIVEMGVPAQIGAFPVIRGRLYAETKAVPA